VKLTMQLTLDGLVRALRLKGHGLAEDIEGGYGGIAKDRDAGGTTLSRPVVLKVRGEEDNDSARR
jgi:hypothetical protein